MNGYAFSLQQHEYLKDQCRLTYPFSDYVVLHAGMWNEGDQSVVQMFKVVFWNRDTPQEIMFGRELLRVKRNPDCKDCRTIDKCHPHSLLLSRDSEGFYECSRCQDNLPLPVGDTHPSCSICLKHFLDNYKDNQIEFSGYKIPYCLLKENVLLFSDADL